jgi:hypothetical protein
MGNITNSLVSVATALIGLAALSVFLSKNANSVAVINSGTSGFNSLLATAISPVSGGGYTGGVNVGSGF